MIIEIAFIISLACIGWHVIISEGFPLSWYGRLLDLLPWWFANPMGRCAGCTASIGTILWYPHLVADILLINVLATMLCVFVLNLLIEKFLFHK